MQPLITADDDELWGLATAAHARPPQDGFGHDEQAQAVDMHIELPKRVDKALQRVLQRAVSVTVRLESLLDLLILQSIILCAFALCHSAFSSSNVISQDEDVHIDKLHGALVAWDLLFWMNCIACHLVALATSAAPLPYDDIVPLAVLFVFPTWAMCNMHVPSSGGRVNTAICTLLQLGAGLAIAANVGSTVSIMSLVILGALDFLLVGVHTSEVGATVAARSGPCDRETLTHTPRNPSTRARSGTCAPSSRRCTRRSSSVSPTPPACSGCADTIRESGASEPLVTAGCAVPVIS